MAAVLPHRDAKFRSVRQVLPAKIGAEGIAMVGSLRRDEDGASAVEYGLLVAGIGAVIALIVFVLGGAVRDQLDSVQACVASADGSACPGEG
ncbi:MAG: Flp family type IVb pilin [Candidatus Nanopelagicales bacterium]|nr:Flp family type IVb pilin [Candidatus Nanopelagicales bacterium]MDZ4249076.1 Flp family type IVb pilin [Candidatus Nanopelagicales bacterium]